MDFLSPKEAIALQQEMRHRVILKNGFGNLRAIAGVDVSYDMNRGLTRAVIAVLDAGTLEPETSAVAFVPTRFPYVPGLLSFREIPAIVEALACLPALPDLLMVDGHGIAHPRRLGIAAHLGALTGLPSIGVGKSRLCGRHDEPGLAKGSRANLTHKGEQIGVVLRSRDGTRPLYISPGHKIDMETAVEITQRCLTRYRLPEPTRLADKISKWSL